MLIRNFLPALGWFLQLCFHKRSVIIVSERNINHMPISGRMQIAILTMIIGSICWASYSTGSYMAAHSTLKQQSKTLRSIANARVDHNFASLYPASMFPKTTISNDGKIHLSDNLFTHASLDSDQLFARVAFLENKVTELQANNEAVIERVRTKTAGRISEIESIIKQTGLNIGDLKKEVAAEESEKKKPEGGPYIPDDVSKLSSDEQEMLSNVDEMVILTTIVSNLPLSMPIKGYEEQSGYGRRIDPFNGGLAFHSGLDMSGPAGSTIYSTADGKVIAAGRNGAYGNAIDIDHGLGITTRYGHLSRIMVEEGQMVRKGDVIGVQGSTGRSTGAHLHYEVRRNDVAMNPKNFLNAGHYVSQN